MGISSLAILSSCQKELSENNITAFCGVSAVTLKDGNGNITARYDYQYDSLLRRPTMMRYQNFEAGTSRTVYPTYSNDTVFFAQNSYLTLDASNRIKTLTEPTQAQANQIDYYYTYNSNGNLDQRLLDDGINDAVHTNFSYNNGNLAGYKQDYAGVPQSLSANITTATTPKISAYGQYAFVEIFPELLFYMPALQLGKMPAFPISAIETSIETTGNPYPSYTTNYSNYTVNAEGWLSTFEVNMTLNGVPGSTIKYELAYTCF